MRISIGLGEFLILAVLCGGYQTAHLQQKRAELQLERARVEALAAEARDRTSTSSNPEPLPAVPAPTVQAPVEEIPEARTVESPGPPRYAFEQLLALFESEEPLEILSPDGIEETLERNGRDPSFLVAAAQLTDDPELSIAYLEEALEKDPTSPSALTAYIGAIVGEGEIDERILDKVDTLEEVDPNNSLANYYAALSRFRTGHADEAMEEIRAGAAKNHLTNYALSHLSTMETFYRDADCSESVAKALSTFNMRLEHLTHMREVNAEVTELIGRAAERGAYDRALSLARDGSQLGKALSQSDRFLITDLMGIAMEGKVLEAELEIHRARGNAAEVERIERRLRSNENRRDIAKRVAAILPRVAAEMSEEELIQYLQRVAIEGEAIAAMTLPQFRGN